MDQVDLGHGRGWLAREHAESIWRIDAELGHPMQITEAGRSHEKADANYAAYLAYLNGAGPWAPIALPGDQSVHCLGGAIDSDEAQQHLELMKRHGWIRTVIRNGVIVEVWHFERFRDHDQHRNDPIEGDDMFTDADRAKIDWLMDQHGGSSSRTTSAREDIDEVLRLLDALAKSVKRILDAVTWLKQRVGGSVLNGAKSLTELLRR